MRSSLRRVWRSLNPATSPAIASPPATPELVNALFGKETDKKALAARARAKVGRSADQAFRRYVDWLRKAGYRLGSVENGPPRFDERYAYLRYDVHIRDLLAVFILADLHEELKIPGSFQICWEYSRAEEEVAEIFLKLRQFDRRYVQFGLHCSPESSWMIAERFGGNAGGLSDFAQSPAFAQLLRDWLAAFERDGAEAPALVEAHAKADAFLARIAETFRRSFGPCATVSAHGNPLNAAFLQAAQADPRLSVLSPYLHPTDFLDAERVVRHGFAYELTRFGTDGLSGPRVIFENPVDQLPLWYGERMAAGAGFVVLSHPATWVTSHFQPLLDLVRAAGP